MLVRLRTTSTSSENLDSLTSPREFSTFKTPKDSPKCLTGSFEDIYDPKIPSNTGLDYKTTNKDTKNSFRKLSAPNLRFYPDSNVGSRLSLSSNVDQKNIPQFKMSKLNPQNDSNIAIPLDQLQKDYPLFFDTKYDFDIEKMKRKNFSHSNYELSNKKYLKSESAISKIKELMNNFERSSSDTNLANHEIPGNNLRRRGILLCKGQQAYSANLEPPESASSCSEVTSSICDSNNSQYFKNIEEIEAVIGTSMRDLDYNKELDDVFSSKKDLQFDSEDKPVDSEDMRSQIPDVSVTDSAPLRAVELKISSCQIEESKVDSSCLKEERSSLDSELTVLQPPIVFASGTIDKPSSTLFEDHAKISSPEDKSPQLRDEKDDLTYDTMKLRKKSNAKNIHEENTDGNIVETKNTTIIDKITSKEDSSTNESNSNKSQKTRKLSFRFKRPQNTSTSSTVTKQKNNTKNLQTYFEQKSNTDETRDTNNETCNVTSNLSFNFYESGKNIKPVNSSIENIVSKIIQQNFERKSIRGSKEYSKKRENTISNLTTTEKFSKLTSESVESKISSSITLEPNISSSITLELNISSSSKDDEEISQLPNTESSKSKNPLNLTVDTKTVDSDEEFEEVVLRHSKNSGKISPTKRFKNKKSPKRCTSPIYMNSSVFLQTDCGLSQARNDSFTSNQKKPMVKPRSVYASNEKLSAPDTEEIISSEDKSQLSSITLPKTFEPLKISSSDVENVSLDDKISKSQAEAQRKAAILHDIYLLDAILNDDESDLEDTDKKSSVGVENKQKTSILSEGVLKMIDTNSDSIHIEETINESTENYLKAKKDSQNIESSEVNSQINLTDVVDSNSGQNEPEKDMTDTIGGYIGEKNIKPLPKVTSSRTKMATSLDSIIEYGSPLQLSTKIDIPPEKSVSMIINKFCKSPERTNFFELWLRLVCAVKKTWKSVLCVVSVPILIIYNHPTPLNCCTVSLFCFA